MKVPPLDGSLAVVGISIALRPDALRSVTQWRRYYRGIASVVEALRLKLLIVLSQPPADCAATRGTPRETRGPRSGPSVTGALNRRTEPSGAHCEPAGEPSTRARSPS